MPRLPLPFLATQFIAPESIFVAVLVVAGHKVSPTVSACVDVSVCVCRWQTLFVALPVLTMFSSFRSFIHVKTF